MDYSDATSTVTNTYQIQISTTGVLIICLLNQVKYKLIQYVIRLVYTFIKKMTAGTMPLQRSDITG